MTKYYGSSRKREKPQYTHKSLFILDLGALHYLILESVALCEKQAKLSHIGYHFAYSHVPFFLMFRS